MSGRYAIAGLTGLIAAACLLWLMQLLVTPPQGHIGSSETAALVDFIRLQREERLELKKQRPDEPPQQPKPLPRPKLDLELDLPQPTPQLNARMNLNLPLTIGNGPYLGPVATQLDRDFVPISRQPPQYPYQAARRGTEGWVRVSFQVTETGTVEDVIVLESDPPGVFDRAAIKAVFRWRFKPRTVNGSAVAGRAEQVVEFKLNN
jgi:periplasmic protein TonB